MQLTDNLSEVVEPWRWDSSRTAEFIVHQCLKQLAKVRPNSDISSVTFVITSIKRFLIQNISYFHFYFSIVFWCHSTLEKSCGLLGMISPHHSWDSSLLSNLVMSALRRQHETSVNGLIYWLWPFACLQRSVSLVSRWIPMPPLFCELRTGRRQLHTVRRLTSPLPHVCPLLSFGRCFRDLSHSPEYFKSSLTAAERCWYKSRP